MFLRFSLLAILASGMISAQAGTPQQASGVRRAYEAGFKAWVLKLRLAASEQERSKITKERPDSAEVAKRMWGVIQPSLTEDWTIEPAAWLLQISAGQMTQDEEGKVTPLLGNAPQVIRAAMMKHHLTSKELAPFCLALVAVNDPSSLSLLEKIEKESPDKKVQGVAALGIAMLLKDLSDEPEVMRKRLSMLRKAIIESSDVEFNGVSVAKMAEDQLYVIRFLSSGREAPNISGVSSGGQAMRLSDYKDKVIVLLFWHMESGNTEQLLEMVTKMRARFAGKPFEIVGVNRDPQTALRQLQASGQIEWPNFSDPESKLSAEFRVTSWPLAYVLDGDRKIHYAGQMGSFVEMTAAAVLQK
jgi:peroxiredoxin